MKGFVIAAALLATASGLAQAQNGTWTEKAAIIIDGVTYGKINHATASAGGYFYTFSGFLIVDGTWDTYTNPLFRYDPVTDSWTTRATLRRRNRSIDGQSAVAIGYGGQIYLLGDTRWQDAPRRYDPAADTWTVLTQIPEDFEGYGFVGGAAAATADRIWVCGGWSDAFYEFNPAANAGLGEWTPSVPLPFPYRRPTFAAIDGKIYLSGGIYVPPGESYYYNTARAFVFDPANPRLGWVEFASMPAARDMSMGMAANGRLYNIVSGQPTYEYDPGTDQWATRTTMPGALYWQGGCTVTVGGRDRIYVMGDEDGRTFEFRPPALPIGTDPFMRIPAGAVLSAGTWTNAVQIEFGATLDLGGSGGLASLSVEIVPAGTDFSGVSSVASPARGDGIAVTSPFALTSGAWKWRYKAVHQNGMAGPWIRFTDGEADLYVDQDPPAAPTGVAPTGRIRITERHGGPVQFAWTGVADDRDIPVTYELEIAVDGAFQNITHAIQTSAQTEVITLPPSVNGQFYHWRVRAIDDVGNAGPWSSSHSFEVFWDDGINHAEGDALRVCGFGAPPSVSGIGFLGLALLLALTRVRRV